MPCIICQSANGQFQELRGVLHVNCQKCGRFLIDEDAAEDFRDAVLGRMNPRQLANASGWIRENPGIHIIGDMLDFLSSIPTPSIAERGDKLLAELDRKSTVPGTVVAVYGLVNSVDEFLGAAWSVNDGELRFLVDSLLVARGFVQSIGVGGQYVVLPAGYDYLDKLRRITADSVVGFAAMWFDHEVNQLWLDGIEPAILAAQYKAVRIDRHEHNNRIDDEIIAMIRKSRFVVADFTGHRGGVYFEAGFALGLGLPVIWTCRNDNLNDLHFDTRQYNFLTWIPGEIASFQGRLTNRIEATIGRGSYRQRGNP